MLKKHVLSILQNRSSKPNQQTIPWVLQEVIHLWLFHIHFGDWLVSLASGKEESGL